MGQMVGNALKDDTAVTNITLGASGPTLNKPWQGPGFVAVGSLSDAAQTLTSASGPYQSMTPSVARTIKLDNSFTAGMILEISNLALASVPLAIITLTANDNTTIATIYQGMTYRVFCNSTTPAGQASWTGLSSIQSQWLDQTSLFAFNTQTFTTSSIFTKRVGDTLFINSALILGTAVAQSAQLVLPTGLTIDTTKILADSVSPYTTQLVGVGLRAVAAGANIYQTSDNGIGGFVDASSNTKILLTERTESTSNFLARNWSAFLATGDGLYWYGSVPITGWTQSRG